MRQAQLGRQVRLVFQDGGRFGLLSRPARCWTPKGIRPVVKNRLVGEYAYAFAAISPLDSVMDSLMILPWVKAETMNLVLLPPYGPELNPFEHLWDHLRENHLAKRPFPSITAVPRELCRALH